MTKIVCIGWSIMEDNILSGLIMLALIIAGLYGAVRFGAWVNRNRE